MQSQDQIDISNAKILVVDDIPANLKVLREVLEPRGFRIFLSPRGDVALKVARSETPDLILLDVMMPGMDGLEVCRLLKADPSTAGIPVIFITAKDDAVDVVNGFAVGGVDYISKPFQAEVVIARTATHLRNGRLARALKTKNEELDAARAAAEKAREAQSTFLATMSHEIRTPMNSVLGMTALLAETPLSLEQSDFVETIRTGSRSLLGVINEILDFSKIESGRMSLESHPFNLNATLEEVVDLLAVKAVEKGLDLAYQIESGLPETFIGDAARMRQVLLNLAGNALKFTAKGEVVINVRRESAGPAEIGSGNAALRFDVRDSGIGIPTEKLDRLFQPFTQVDSSTTRQYGGTGLGLAISKRLVELMGGRMWLESQSGAGSTFHFAVPLPAATNDGASPWPTLARLSGKSALIIEDSPTNAAILAQYLGHLNVSSRLATTFTDALSTLGAARADLALLDMQIPPRDGFGLAKTLRQTQAGADLELLLLTSQPVREGDPRLAEVKAAAIIAKPIRRSQFLRAMRLLADPTNVTAATPAPSAFDPTLAARAPLRILLADDHDVNQKVGARILQGFGYRCELAANGIEVIQAIERQPFDLLFLDIEMPEMDGYETTRRIRQRWTEAERPRLVAMTANVMRGEREKCLESGMDDYIPKPIEISEVRRALEYWGARASGATPPPDSAARVAPSRPESSPAPPAADALIDWYRFHEMLGNDVNAMEEFVALYCRRTQEQIDQLAKEIAAGDVKQTLQVAHRCKGASATCGIDGVARLMGEIERGARVGDISAAPRLHAEATVCFARVREALAERLNAQPVATPPAAK